MRQLTADVKWHIIHTIHLTQCWCELIQIWISFENGFRPPNSFTSKIDDFSLSDWLWHKIRHTIKLAAIFFETHCNTAKNKNTDRGRADEEEAEKRRITNAQIFNFSANVYVRPSNNLFIGERGIAFCIKNLQCKGTCQLGNMRISASPLEAIVCHAIAKKYFSSFFMCLFTLHLHHPPVFHLFVSQYHSLCFALAYF